MEILNDKHEVLITPDDKFATRLIDEVITTKGLFYLNDAIKEALSYGSISNEGLSFSYKGVYPNEFISRDDVLQFKLAIEELLSNKDNIKFKITNVDDLLFITYLYFGYSGEVYSAMQHSKYLDELADVFFKLYKRQHTPTEEALVWVQDVFTGIERQVPKANFTDEELKLNGGYLLHSRMIGEQNKTIHLPNDGDLSIMPRGNNKEHPIVLPKRLAKDLTNNIISLIIKEHKQADTVFYKEICNGDVGYLSEEWGRRTAPRTYKYDNKVLTKLIKQLDDYLLTKNKSTIRAERHVFIYDFFSILKLVHPHQQVDRTYKSSAIRTIIRVKSYKGGNTF